MNDPVTLGLLMAVVLILVVVLTLLFTGSPRAQRPPRGAAAAFHLLLEGRRSEARDLLASLVREGEASAEVYLHLGNILREDGDAQRALQLHGGLLARPQMGEDIRRLAELSLADDLLDLGRVEEAETRLAKLADRYEDPNILARHARALHRLGRLEDAAAAMEMRAALTDEVGAHEAACYLSEMAREFLRDGRPQTAQELTKRALRLDASVATSYEVDGDRLMAQQRPDKAVAIWREGLRAAPEGSQSFLPRLAEAAFRAGQIDTLLADLDRERETAPNNAALWRAVADLRLRRGDLESFFALVESPPRLDAAGLEAWAGWIRHLRSVDEGTHLKRLLRSMPEAFATRQFRCVECGATDGEPRLACAHCGCWTPLVAEDPQSVQAALALPGVAR